MSAELTGGDMAWTGRMIGRKRDGRELDRPYVEDLGVSGGGVARSLPRTALARSTAEYLLAKRRS